MTVKLHVIQLLLRQRRSDRKVNSMNRQKIRLENFEYLMNIVDAYEGERDTTFGALSFLWEESYVRESVVTPGEKTSIAGLKTFLATEILEIYGASSKSKISYKNIYAYLKGDESKKYRFSFQLLDDVFDKEKNKELLLEECKLLPQKVSLREVFPKTDIWVPYILMHRLRKVIWKKLRYYFQLCNEDADGKTEKKRDIYFQFIRAVALYEIFLVECIQEQGTLYIEQALAEHERITSKLEEMRKKKEELLEWEERKEEEQLALAESISQDVKRLKSEHVSNFLEMSTITGVFQILNADFGISFCAMLFLLISFESMLAFRENMGEMKEFSVKMQEELQMLYNKNIEFMQNDNKNRTKRYKKINEKFEEILEHYEVMSYKEAGKVIALFMEELCKPVSRQSVDVLQELERKLAGPIYHFEKTK